MANSVDPDHTAFLHVPIGKIQSDWVCCSSDTEDLIVLIFRNLISTCVVNDRICKQSLYHNFL